MKLLGGWWRFWIALAMLWALALVIHFYPQWPTAENIAARSWIDDEIHEDVPSLAKLGAKSADWGAGSARYDLAMFQARDSFAAIAHSGLASQSKAVARIRKLRSEKRDELIHQIALLWFYPSAGLLAFGLIAAWIRNGFRVAGAAGRKS